MRRLFHIVLFLALAICQVPGSVVVGRCEMTCCTPEISDVPQFQEKSSCCCSFTEIKRHVDNDVSASRTITGDFETFALPQPTHLVQPLAVLASREPIPHAQGPPGRGAIWQPPTRAPPVS